MSVNIFCLHFANAVTVDKRCCGSIGGGDSGSYMLRFSIKISDNTRPLAVFGCNGTVHILFSI